MPIYRILAPTREKLEDSNKKSGISKILYQKFAEILEFPVRWRFREDLFPSCQVAAEGRHLILFQINNDILLIVRILHDSMDLVRKISSEFKD